MLPTIMPEASNIIAIFLPRFHSPESLMILHCYFHTYLLLFQNHFSTYKTTIPVFKIFFRKRGTRMFK